MSIATRKGDDGTTSLLFGQRVPKNHPQIEAVGAFDELNVALGAVKSLVSTDSRGSAIRDLVTAVQHNLVALMGEVACAETDLARYAESKFAKLRPEDVAHLDREVAALEARSLRFDGWATPGANSLSVAFEQARVSARRAERRLSALPSLGGWKLRPTVSQFINRLSDVLWLLAREAEQ